jgi:Ran GTPase-activating protein (RanGAP) involved in mRNA processing and transport
MQHGLMTIDLSGNSIKKSIAPLVAAFQRNVRMSDSLSKLNLSNAKLGNEGSSALSAWLSNPNSLRELILRDSNANPLVISFSFDDVHFFFEKNPCQLIGQALCHGSVASLEVLDLSHNKFVKGVSVADLAAFFSTAKRLSAVLLSSTSPSTEQLRDLIRSLSGNAEIERLELDLSGNSLGVVGANLLAIELKQFLSLAVLNCADNGFKVESKKRQKSFCFTSCFSGQGFVHLVRFSDWKRSAASS